MAVVNMSASSRRNVKPTSSTLKMTIEDIDCSAMTVAPEDGQFICVAGTAAADEKGGADLVVDHNTTANITANDPVMVWGSALRSDRSALGDSRVPVIRSGGGRFRTKIFRVADHQKGLAESENGYAPGARLSIEKPSAAMEGSIDRLILLPLTLHNAASAMCVGTVVRVVTDSAVSGTGEIEIQLWDSPRIEVK